jgi:uncharacterized protein YaiL (DUF2058 family)
VTYVTAGEAIRQREVQERERMQKAAAAAEQAKADRIERWGKALSVLPEDELIGIAQRWSSHTESVVPAAQRALDIKKAG